MHTSLLQTPCITPLYVLPVRSQLPVQYYAKKTYFVKNMHGTQGNCVNSLDVLQITHALRHFLGGIGHSCSDGIARLDCYVTAMNTLVH